MKRPKKGDVARCLGCGEGFVKPRDASVSCGKPECRRQAMKVRQALGLIRPRRRQQPVAQKPCEECGRDYKRTHTIEKYCTKCRLIVRRRKSAEANVRTRKRSQRTAPIVKAAAELTKLRSCLQCGRMFLSEGPWHRCCGSPACELRRACGGCRRGRHRSYDEIIEAVLEIEYQESGGRGQESVEEQS